jgi:hypothetical protein
LLRDRRHGQTNEILGQAKICEDPASVVVEVQEGAGLQLEDSWAPLAKHWTSTELRKKRRDAGESIWTGVFHLSRLTTRRLSGRRTGP